MGFVAKTDALRDVYLAERSEDGIGPSPRGQDANLEKHWGMHPVLGRREHRAARANSSTGRQFVVRSGHNSISILGHVCPRYMFWPRGASQSSILTVGRQQRVVPLGKKRTESSTSTRCGFPPRLDGLELSYDLSLLREAATPISTKLRRGIPCLPIVKSCME